MYHCDGDNINGIWDHIASGMYGGIVVHPKNEKPAKEFYMVVGEIYNTEDRGLFIGASNSANATSATTTTAVCINKRKISKGYEFCSSKSRILFLSLFRVVYVFPLGWVIFQ